MATESNIRERERVRRDKLASYFFGLSKLSYAGLVIGIILPLMSDVTNVGIWAVILAGVAFTVSSALLANKLLKF